MSNGYLQYWNVRKVDITLEIILRKLGKNYSNEKSILRNVNYIFKEGIYLIKGTSGIGKTTLLNIISGYSTASEGEVILHNIKKICYIMQETLMFSNLTIKENMMIMYPNSIDVLEEKVKEKTRNLGLNEEIMTKRPTNLSGGQIKKAELLLYTIFNDFDVLLLDEPVSNLDDESIFYVIKYIESLLKEKKIVLIVSHIDLQFEVPYTVLEVVKGELKEKNEL